MGSAEVPKEQEKHLANGKTANVKKAPDQQEDAVPPQPWNLPEGDRTEVLDDEGHRNTLNKKH